MGAKKSVTETAAMAPRANDSDEHKPETYSFEEESLYVVQETIIRGMPARILSDGTIEAQLPEGWLRFENMEHLIEYTDALEELRRKGVI